MGVICPCGVIVDAVSTNNNVVFDGVQGTIEGNINYSANICVNTPNTNLLSLVFEDTETDNGEFDFTFTATSFTSVECNRIGENCEVTVEGTGTINGSSYSFHAEFRDMNPNANVDNVQDFVIFGYFDQNGAAPVAQGSITAVGCEDAE